MEKEIAERKEKLILDIKEKLPSFYEMVEEVRKDKLNKIYLHQDAFAADYQEEEYSLLGMAIKYAGMYGIQIIIDGSNRDTLYPITQHKS